MEGKALLLMPWSNPKVVNMRTLHKSIGASVNGKPTDSKPVNLSSNLSVPGFCDTHLYVVELETALF